MKKILRIIQSILIGVIGSFTTYSILDLLYRVVFLSLKLFDPIIPREIFAWIVVLLISLSAIPALIFHIRLIKSANSNKDYSDSDQSKTKKSFRKFGNSIWFGNFLFGLLNLLISGKYFYDNIGNTLNKDKDVLYYSYFVFGLILINSIIIVLDALIIKIKNRSNRE